MRTARFLCARFLFCVGFAALLGSAHAASIQVNPGGSITNAMTSASPGDTVHVSTGTYNENVQINTSGSSSAYITLVADGAVVINAGGAGKAIRIAASYIVVNGFECTNFLEGINFRTSHIKIQNCNVHSGTSMSNPVAGSNGITVNFNPTIDDLDIENSNFYFNDAGGADFGCNSATDVLSNLLIKNCKFYANNCVNGTDGIGIGHYGTKTNISLIRCEAYDNLSDGFDLDAPVYMDGCIAHDNDKLGGPSWGVGIKVWGHSGNPSVYGQVRLYNCLSYNNTQETDGGGGINIGGVNSIVANCLVSGNNSYAGLIISSGASVTVQNTIFYNEHYSVSADSDTSHLTFDSSNVIFNCTSNGALSATAAAQAKTFNPQFINPTDNDVAPWANFRLQSSSPAINAGISINGLINDADGNPRPSGGSFDIGPYEFQSGNAPSITSATTASGTAGIPFSYTITASNSPTGFDAQGLPTGLSINKSSGLISGTATVSGTFSVALSASNASGTGTATLQLTMNPAPVGPSITTQPTNQTVTAGQTATFSVTASGTAPLAYQWTRNGANISGATQSSYTTPAASTSDSGAMFKVIVSNNVNSVTSNGATLTVNAASSLLNGSFETPSVGSAAYTYNPVGGAWTFAGNSGIQSNGSAWNAANAPDGVQTAFLQSNGPLGAISQPVSLANGNYTLTFQLAQRSYGDGTQPVRFSVDGAQIGTLFTPASTAFSAFTSAAFNVSAGVHVFKFEATDSTGDRSTFIDAVSMTLVTPPQMGIANGSFETPSVGAASYAYNPVGGAWTFSGNSGIQSNGSAWNASTAPDGVQTAFLQGNPAQGTLGKITQSVMFPQAGTFTITFSAARRSGQIQPIRILVDNAQVGSLIRPSSNSFATFTSAAFTINTAGTHSLAFQATNNTGDKTSFIDRVSISATRAAASLASDVAPGFSMTSSPTASPSSAVAGQIVAFTAAASGDEGDPLDYAWDFGDGSSGAGSSVTHAYASPGPYVVSVTVTDSEGESTTDSLSVTVTSTALPLNIAHLSGRVRFNTSGQDSAIVQGSLADVPATFNPVGQTVIVAIQGVAATFVLDAKGRAKTGASSLTIKTRRENAGSVSAVFSAALKGGTWAQAWGIQSDSNATNSPLDMTVSLIIGSAVYKSNVTVKASVKANIGAAFRQ